MTASATCPVCGNPQAQGLLDDACTTRLERDLRAVPAIVTDLDIAISKQARIGNNSGPGGLARERTPINVGAMNVARDLSNTLTTWARDVAGDSFIGDWIARSVEPGPRAARALLHHIDAIRRHPAVNELCDEIHDAITQARRIIDRPADRQYLGTCLVALSNDEGQEVTCLAEVWARQGASQTACKVCGITHDVRERQKALLKDADDLLFSIREAAQIIGSLGDKLITESTIRSYVSKGQLGYHGKIDGVSVIRIGDLIEVITEHAAKPKGRKLRDAS